MDSSRRLPIPAYFTEAQQLSTKKELRALHLTPKERPPAKPLGKSTSFRRYFRHSQVTEKAHAVSFQNNGERSILSKHYDESCSELYFNQCFTIISVLGAGSFGKVFKVQSKEDGKFYAVKKSKECFKGKLDRQNQLEEVKKHEQLPKHPNCVNFVKAWEEKNHLYIQTELCETSLSILSEQNDSIPEKLIWTYLVDLLQAVKHLHDHNLLHLDIKPANIFVSSLGVCKLGDFGLVVDQTKDLIEPLEGDPKYMAPELMNGIFTKAADIFSIGMTILELGGDLDLPRGGPTWHELRTGCLPHQFITHMSSDLQMILTSMLNPQHTKRPTAEQLLKHPTVSKMAMWRNSKLSFKSWFSYFSVFQNGFNIFSSVFSLLLRFIKKTLNRRQDFDVSWTPKRNIHDLDFSFSDDDECNENENPLRGDADWSRTWNFTKLNLSNLSNESLSDDSHCKSFTDMIHDERLVNSTPLQNRKKVSHSDASPNLEKCKNERDSVSFLSDVSNEDTEFNQIISDSTKFDLEPKNLLEVFENMSDDEY